MGEVVMQPMGGGVGSDDVTATKAQVLTGYNTVTTDSDDEVVAGTMPNQGGHQSSTGVGGGSGSLWAYMPYGYYDNYNNSGNAWIDITDDQAKTLANNAGVGYNSGYSKGVSDADGRVNTSSASYNSGYAKGNSVKPSNFIIGVAVAEHQEGFSGTTYAWGRGCRVDGDRKVIIDPGYYYHVAVYDGDWNQLRWVTNTNGYASSTITFSLSGANKAASMGVALTSNYPIF